LILREISKIGAIRLQILRLKYTKLDFRWGSAPDPTEGAYSAPPDRLAVFKGPILLRGGRGKGTETEGGMGGEERGELPHPVGESGSASAVYSQYY